MLQHRRRHDNRKGGGMKYISDPIICRDIGDLQSFIKMFNIDCPITPLNVQYQMDTEGNGSLKITELEEKTND